MVFTEIPKLTVPLGSVKRMSVPTPSAGRRGETCLWYRMSLVYPTHPLITESPTRWGSRQQMIEQVLEQEKSIARVLGSEKKNRHLVASWQDIDVLKSVNEAVSPLQEFTDALSGEAYVSVSYLKPVLHLFKNSLLQPEEGETELTK